MSDKKKNLWENGLGKQCAKHEDWTRCSCPWWGKYRGIRRSLAKWARTRITGKEQAKAILNRLKTEIDSNGTTGKCEGMASNAAMSVSQFIDLYEKNHVRVHELADKSLPTALRRIKDHFGPLPLAALASSGPIEDWIATMKTAKLSARSQKVYATRLRTALNWAKSRKLISESGFDSGSIRFTKDASRNRVLLPGEEAALLEACDRMNTRQFRFTGTMAKGRLICALDTGLRAGAMRHLQNKHIDFENWVLRIPAAIQKDAEPLEIPVESPRLRSFLKQRRILGLEAYTFGHGAGNERFKNGSYQADIRKTVGAMFKLAGIPLGRANLVWHDFRHDVATILVTGLGVPLTTVKEITGHSETRMLERYVNPQMDARRTAMRQLSEERQLRMVREAEAKEALNDGSVKASGE